MTNPAPSSTALAALLRDQQQSIVQEWAPTQVRAAARTGAMSEAEVREQCAEFLRLLGEAASQGLDTAGQAFTRVREFLAGISRSRAVQGVSPTDTAMFIFSLKPVLFERLRAGGGDGASDAILAASDLIDRLGLYTAEMYQKGREEVISRQQQDLLELSTPVVKLWEGVLALPMIGTLDSARTQVVMESLLQRIVETGAEVAIIDITGVPTVDTLTAQHLIKTVTAARLMGAECIISGIRPQIAQTIVHLGVDLGNVITKATLADAFRVALQRGGLAVVKRGAPAPAAPIAPLA
ncbi:MAG TPA: STAS domain-containing protein [Gemmatimonadaceae bacterium]